jgi:hypothetical protein
MEKLYKLKERLINELEEQSENGFSASSLDIIKKASSAADHICNVIRDCEEQKSGYSERGYSSGMYYAADPMGRDVEPGRGTSYGGSSYARGRMNAPRDAMGRFSGAGEGMRGYSGDGYSMRQDPARDLRELIPHAPDEQTRRMMEEIARKMER